MNLDLLSVPCHNFTAIRGYTRQEIQEVTSFDWSVWKVILERMWERSVDGSLIEVQEMLQQGAF